MSRIRLKGFSVSGGMAHGRVAIIPSVQSAIPRRRIESDDVNEECQRLDGSLDQSRKQLQGLIARIDPGDEIRGIFEAQAVFLDDPLIVEETRRRISEKNRNCEWALSEVLTRLKKRMSALDDPSFRERAADLEDVGNRILSNLMNVQEGDVRIPLLQRLSPDSIVVAEEIPPSLMLHIRGIGGIATEKGGVTGHMAILARSRGIPALVGVHGLLLAVREGEEVLLDSRNGDFVIGPDEREIERLREFHRLRGEAGVEEVVSSVRLSDGDTATVWANVDEPEDADDERILASFGVGLMRTEFMYLKKPLLIQSRNAQSQLYARVLDKMRGKPVVFRLLDIGEDKSFSAAISDVFNPYDESLRHLRGLRYLLANEELLNSQLSAILCAVRDSETPDGNCKIMLPMVTVVDEIQELLARLKRVREDLTEEGIIPGRAPELPVGLMLETPAACMMADVLSSYADFFSVGTNDLARYTLAAASRDSVRQGDMLYEPSVFRLIRIAVQKAKVPLSVCGEMASIPELIPLLLGLGVRQFSVARSALSSVSRVLGRLELGECRRLADAVLAAHTASDVREILERQAEAI